MRCQNCGNKEANFNYTEIVNGIKKEIHVCEECAKELGIENISFDMPMSFSSFLGDIFGVRERSMPEFMKSASVCMNCNTSFEDFINTGLFSCPKCYTTYEERIDPILKKLQGSNQHIGRKAHNLKNINEDLEKIKEKSKSVKNKEEEKIENKNTKENKLEKLKKDLELAIKDERYEDAAQIRDEINKLEK